MNNLYVTVLVVVAALFSGCASTLQARDVQPTSFLAEDQSLLRPGKEGEETLLVYGNPMTDWVSYNKILLQPVTIWDESSSHLSREEREALQRLADRFYDMLYTKLSKDYEIVEKPGPGTMRVQAAITHGEESVPTLTFVTKLIPQARIANLFWTIASGKPAFAGEVTLEFKEHDSVTGELLAAGVDRRVGGTNLFDKEVFDAWGDVKNSLEFWSDGAVYHLCVLRGGTDCVKPKA